MPPSSTHSEERQEDVEQVVESQADPLTDVTPAPTPAAEPTPAAAVEATEAQPAPVSESPADPRDEFLYENDKMPAATIAYTDSCLFLPVERSVMHFTIDRTTLADGVWIYHITLNTSLPFYTQMEHAESQGTPAGPVAISRQYRYSKFDWLKQALTTEYPSVIIPPTPPKDASMAAEKLLNFMSDPSEDEPPPLLVIERRRELQYFMNYIASHPALREGTILRGFLSCISDSQFSTLRDKTKQMHDEAVRQRLRPEDSRRNAAYQTKNAFSWLKGKVTGGPVKDAEPNPVTADLATYIQGSQPLVELLRAKMGNYYLQTQSRVHEKQPDYHSGVAEWSTRGYAESDLAVGSLVCFKNGQVGTAMWVGNLPHPQSSEVHAGIQWLSKRGGNCDGAICGERYFQGTNGRTGCSFVPYSHLYHPLPRDPVIDAIDFSSEALFETLVDFTPEQEKRLFHILSDLQIIRGWFESAKKCVAHFNNVALTEASFKAALANKKEKKDAAQEAELEERLAKFSKQANLEKMTFTAEKELLKKSTAGLWRSVLSNFATFNANIEVHQGFDMNIAEASSAIQTAWS